MDERGQFTDLFLVFIILIFGLVVWVWLGGLGANLTTAFYSANQANLSNIQNSINNIQDANVQGDLNSLVDSYNEQQTTGISLFMYVSTYGAIFTIITIILVLFLIRRQDVQVGGMR